MAAAINPAVDPTELKQVKMQQWYALVFQVFIFLSNLSCQSKCAFSKLYIDEHLPKDMKVRHWWICFYGDGDFRQSLFNFPQQMQLYGLVQ